MKTGVSYFGNRNPKWVRHDMLDIVEHNCNFVLHTFSEFDRLFYKDTMKAIVDISHEVGLEVYVDPWGVGNVFGGEPFSKIVNEHDICQVDNKFNPLPAACVNNPRFVDFMYHWIEDVKYIDGDVLFWDEPHFYNPDRGWACRCKYCQKEFKRIFGYDMPETLNPDILKFKELSIVRFVKQLAEYGKRLGMRSAVCMLPQESDKSNVNDWGKIAAIDSIDIIGTDPYEYHRMDFIDRIRGYANKIYNIASEFAKDGQLWVQCFSIKEGEEWKVRKAVETIYDAGIRNIGAWSYEGTSYMSYVKSDNPKKVWETLKEAYGRCIALASK